MEMSHVKEKFVSKYNKELLCAWDWNKFSLNLQIVFHIVLKVELKKEAEYGQHGSKSWHVIQISSPEEKNNLTDSLYLESPEACKAHKQEENSNNYCVHLVRTRYFHNSKR